MYLDGLSDWGTQLPSQVAAQNAANAQTMLTSMQYNSCLHAGGYWDGSTCHLPQPAQVASSAPITITVPTAVNTQVSPQISPNLIQQQQPTNSPVGASTSSNPAQLIPTPSDVYGASTGSQQAQQGATDAALQEFLAAQAAHDKAMQDAMAAQQAPPQTIMIPNAPAPSVTVTPVDNTPAPVQTATMPDTSKYILYGVAALLGVTLIMARKKH